MFTFLIFILLIGSSLYFTFSASKKDLFYKRQILYLTRQNRELKSNLDKKTNALESLTIQYIKPNKRNGIVIFNCNLYAAPTENSPILGTLEKNINLNILDSAKTLGKIWYEVSFNLENNINNKGWIINTDVQLIDIISLQTDN